MAQRAALLPQEQREPLQGDFKASIQALLQRPGVQHVFLPALSINAWLMHLGDGSKLHIYEEELTEDNFACDCCRIVGEPRSPAGSDANFRASIHDLAAPRRPSFVAAAPRRRLLPWRPWCVCTACSPVMCTPFLRPLQAGSPTRSA
jgi:hypothetical protein